MFRDNIRKLDDDELCFFFSLKALIKNAEYGYRLDFMRESNLSQNSAKLSFGR
jgi:hypothetical protein